MLKPLLVAALLPAGLLLPTAASAAVAPSCHGHRATIVGTHDAFLKGTPHADVIVTNGAVGVTGRGGDDLICVTRNVPEVEVTGGNDDDTVYVESHGSSVSFRAGGGSDTYVGNGKLDNITLRPDGHDRIRAGGGPDFVTVAPSGRTGSPRVDLGGGGDHLYLDLRGSGGRYSGGGGADSLEIAHGSKSPWLIDNAHGKAVADGDVRFHWRGFEQFDMSFLRAPQVSFSGSDAAEQFYMQDDIGHPRQVAVSMGGGDDAVTLSGGETGPVDGGSGTDTMTFMANQVFGTTVLTADLLAGTAVADSGPDAAWTLHGLENLVAGSYPVIKLYGDDGPNHLTAAGCQPSLDGRGGDDVLVATSGCSYLPSPVPALGAVVQGGDGNDSLTGGYLDDTLDGGPGTDSADGSHGTDTCYAETVVNCELG